jgi:hypothetical protein
MEDSGAAGSDGAHNFTYRPYAQFHDHSIPHLTGVVIIYFPYISQHSTLPLLLTFLLSPLLILWYPPLTVSSAIRCVDSGFGSKVPALSLTKKDVLRLMHPKQRKRLVLATSPTSPHSAGAAENVCVRLCVCVATKLTVKMRITVLVPIRVCKYCIWVYLHSCRTYLCPYCEPPSELIVSALFPP